MDMNQAVAKAVSAERAISGMTVRELSEASGIPVSTLMRILSAERDIKINQISQLARAFHTTAADIVWRAQEIIRRG